MKVFLVCAFVLMTAVGAVKSPPPRKAKFCCFPLQFEASMDEVAGYALSNGKGVVSNSLSKMAVDYKNELVAANKTLTVNGKTTKSNIIINYKEKVYYVIVGETCIKAVWNESLMKCIPDNAEFGGSFYFGDKKLVTNTYNFPLKQAGIFEGNATVTVTQDKCIHVSSLLIGRTMASHLPSRPVLMNSAVYNFKSGIKDPQHWFTPPSFCPREISEVSQRSVNSNAVLEFMTLSNVLMESTVEE